MNYSRPIILGLVFSCISTAALAQGKRIQIPTDEKSILPKYDLSGFYHLMKQKKVKEATALIDRLQIAYPEEQEIERHFVMMFICQERDSEVVSRAAQYVQMPQVKNWLGVPKAKLNLQIRTGIATYSAKSKPVHLRQVAELQNAYSQILTGPSASEWVKLGFLNRVFKDDPNNPEAICHLFGTMSNAECVSKMRTFSLDRLWAAYARGNPYSSQRVLKNLIETKNWMTSHPNGVPYAWRDSTTVLPPKK